MADNYSQIEKSISFFINQQFPAIYREDGPELVQLAKDYYKFMETQSNQSLYVSRRFYDYKDIDTVSTKLNEIVKNEKITIRETPGAVQAFNEGATAAT